MVIYGVSIDWVVIGRHGPGGDWAAREAHEHHILRPGPLLAPQGQHGVELQPHQRATILQHGDGKIRGCVFLPSFPSLPNQSLFSLAQRRSAALPGLVTYW